MRGDWGPPNWDDDDPPDPSEYMDLVGPGCPPPLAEIEGGAS